MCTAVLAAPTYNTEHNAALTRALLAVSQQSVSNAAVASVDVSRAVPQVVHSLTTRLRKRHSKRHSNWYDYYNFNENATAPEWINPCGGYYEESKGASMRRKSAKQISNILRKSVDNELLKLRNGPQDINISDISMWSLYEYNYKFLPKLRLNSSIALKRWNRNMQTYVASLAYLLRAQLKWDHSKSQSRSRTARELNTLLRSAKRMACLLEMAVNVTRPYPHQTRNGKREEQHISREQMQKILKLGTKRNDVRLMEADAIDLKFVKHYYFKYLQTMRKVLRKNTKRRGQVALKDNRTEFNEVEKHFGSIAATHAPQLPPETHASLRNPANSNSHNNNNSNNSNNSSRKSKSKNRNANTERRAPKGRVGSALPQPLSQAAEYA